MLHGAVNEAAALTGLHEPVDGADRGLRQDDVDAFGHWGCCLMICFHSVYARRVYVK